MYKYFIPFLSVILLYAACNSTGRYGITQKYKVQSPEREIPLNKTIVDKYEAIINTDTLNIPLNKYIIGHKYKVYIGVALNSSLNDLFQRFSNDTAHSVYLTDKKDDAYSFVMKKQNEFFYTYIYSSETDKLTYLLCLEADSAMVENKFNTKFLQKKIEN